jgi:hypothetical protein
MTRGHGLSHFHQADLARMLKAMRSAGMKVDRVERGVDGKIAIIVDRNGNEETCNPWDEVLKDEDKV